MTYVLVIDQSTLDLKKWCFTLARQNREDEGRLVSVDLPATGTVEIHGNWSECLYELCRTIELIEHGERKRQPRKLNYPATRKSTPRLPMSGGGGE